MLDAKIHWSYKILKLDEHNMATLTCHHPVLIIHDGPDKTPFTPRISFE